MTREQLQMAEAVRDELLLQFFALNDAADAMAALTGICRHYELQPLDAQALPAVARAVLAVEAAHSAYEEFFAAVQSKTGDPAAGNASPVAGEPLKVAA